MRLEWNTGRLYAEDGQRIVAEVVADGVVFYDCARGFGGKVSLPDATGFSEMPSLDRAAIQRHVMREYDYNRITSDYDTGVVVDALIASVTPGVAL
jgi:hypothetical protein